MYTGPEFEERIRLNEAGNPKFNFLALHDPYHAYYEHKIKEIREGVAQEAAAAPPPLMQQVHKMKERALNLDIHGFMLAL